MVVRIRERNSGTVERGLEDRTGHTSQPLLMLQPTTAHALPFARISNGKMSTGYSKATVTQVAPNMAVNTRTNKVGAIPALTQSLD